MLPKHSIYRRLHQPSIQLAQAASMATTAPPNGTDQSPNVNTVQTVDDSLWWEPFVSLLTELENADLSSDIPQSLETKLKDNHLWFLETTSQFKPSNQKSRDALNSSHIKIGSRELNIQPELKDVALKIGSVVCLDEVQSYILVTRSVERNNTVVSTISPEILSLVMIEYYIERQCLLKCTRQILTSALYFGSQSGGSNISEEALRLISDGLESKLLSIFQNLLSANYPEEMDVDLYTLWAEETLIEDNLILDILFLAYYESFCTCDAKSWKKLCMLYEDIVTGSYNFQKLAVSPEAVRAIYHAKVQLLLILIEALNLENLLQMIHDNVPFRQGSIAFSEMDVQDMDAMFSNFSAFEAKEAGPLILAWAVFLCLISSLPEKGKNNLLMEIDQIGYVRQAFEASSLGYFLEILQSDTFTDSDGPLLGYRSVLRTFISAFIASYEISLQFEDGNLKIVLEILNKIYRGEESLCNQFWDRDSFIDGPVRCLLCNLEGEFPFRTVELVSLLSGLSEGAWPSECVFNFLDKSVGLSTPLEMSSDCGVDAVSMMVETRVPRDVDGFEGLVIPSKCRGQVLRMIDRNVALVRWEYAESGVLVLLLHLARNLYFRNPAEIIAVLDLLSRLVTFNTAVCYSLLDAWKSTHNAVTPVGDQKKYVCIDVVEIVCALVKSVSPSVDGAIIMSMGVNVLAKMLRCLPSYVASKAVKGNIFDVALTLGSSADGPSSLSSGTWLLSGRLAKMLLIDCEESDCSMTLSVLEFTMKLLESGLETDTALALVVFSLQYVFVNHEFWNYKVKHARWNVTAKVLEIMKKCLSISCYQKLGKFVRDILLSDASIHSTLFKIVCTTTENLEKLNVSRVFEILDIEGLQLAISFGLDVLVSMVSALSKEFSSLPVFHQAILSPVTKPVPVITAAISLMSYFSNPKIQIGAARLLSVLFIADLSQSCRYSTASLGLDDKQVVNFRKSVCRILSEQLPWNQDLILSTLKLLTSAAHNQPVFLTAVIAIESGSLSSKDENILERILHYVNMSNELLKIKSDVLSNVLSFLRALWQGAPQFHKYLEYLKKSDKFWKQLTDCLVLVPESQNKFRDRTGNEIQTFSTRYQCMSIVLEILCYEIFIQKKWIHNELTSLVPKLLTNGTEGKEDSKITNGQSLSSLKEIISTWCKSSSLSNLIKDCVSCEYDTSHELRAKVAACLFVVHVMVKLQCGKSGSLSVSLTERIVALSEKLRKCPAFLELTTQYTERGYSGGLELENLILSDLFYQIEGEMEERHIENRPFKELFQVLLDSEFLEAYRSKQDDDFLENIKGFYLYDTVRLRADIGLEMWDLLPLKPSKSVAETMLLRLQDINSTLLHSNSKLSALRGLITLLYLHNDNLTNEASTKMEISEKEVSSCINHICRCLHAKFDSLTPFLDINEKVLDILTAQSELLLLLLKSLSNNPACVLVLKTCGHGLKVLSNCRTSVGIERTKTLLLMLIITSLKLTSKDQNSSAEASNARLGLLPILCNCIEQSDQCTLSLTAIDLIIKSFSTPTSWFPIIQKHLPLHRIVQNLQEVTSLKTVSVILKFLLNVAPVRHGAHMLLNAGVISSIRMLLSDFSEKNEKPQSIWGLSLAVLTSIIQNLGNDSSSTSTVEHIMASVLIEHSPLISYYLSVPDFPSNGHERKRARALKSNISLSELKETENTLSLICALARCGSAWNKVLKDMETQIREKSIHLLAFISRATQRPGESPGRDVPLLCYPVLKEEFQLYEKQPFVKSSNGWFALSAIGSKVNQNRDQSNDGAGLALQTHFSDVVAIEMYRIAILILGFLCVQAESAAKKAENVGFVEITHFPELPMPDILHGLQDQAMVIITELCEANKTKQPTTEIKDICILLMQIIVMSLYLEFCVIQICDIRPVLGHVETFSKELRLLVKATNGYAFLKEPLNSLKEIVSFVYPELIRSEGIF